MHKTQCLTPKHCVTFTNIRVYHYTFIGALSVLSLSTIKIKLAVRYLKLNSFTIKLYCMEVKTE